MMLFSILHASAQSESRKQVIRSYQSQIGVSEETGKNDGYDVEKYLASTGLTGGFAWCAAFVNWNLEVNCIKGPEELPAWSPSWFPPEKTYWLRGEAEYYQPQPADVFGIYFKSKGRIAHVGFIHDWSHSDYALTVEGNTNDAGSREGDGVHRKRRLKRTISKVSNWIER